MIRIKTGSGCGCPQCTYIGGEESIPFYWKKRQEVDQSSLDNLNSGLLLSRYIKGDGGYEQPYKDTDK